MNKWKVFRICCNLKRIQILYYYNFFFIIKYLTSHIFLKYEKYYSRFLIRKTAPKTPARTPAAANPGVDAADVSSTSPKISG